MSYCQKRNNNNNDLKTKIIVVTEFHMYVYRNICG